MSKPGGDPSSGISLGGVLIRPKRHPAWKAAAFLRWHEPDDARVSSPDL
jgi:hypothetical protein